MINNIGIKKIRFSFVNAYFITKWIDRNEFCNILFQSKSSIYLFHYMCIVATWLNNKALRM